MWKTGKRYLSGDSLTQLYQGIVGIHGNINRINELLKARAEHYNFASNFVTKYTSLEREDFNTVKKAAKEELEAIKSHESVSIKNMADIYEKELLPIVKKVSTAHDKTLNKDQVIKNILNVITELNTFEKNQIPRIYNLDIQKSMKIKIQELKEILELYESKNAERKDGKLVIKWDTIKNKINKITADLKKELLNEVQIFKEVEKAADESKAELNTDSPKVTTAKEVKTKTPDDIGTSPELIKGTINRV
jgi:hypothetical protein